MKVMAWEVGEHQRPGTVVVVVEEFMTRGSGYNWQYGVLAGMVITPQHPVTHK